MRMAWINEQQAEEPDKPWFVWLAFNLAHISGNQRPNPMAVPNIDTLDEPSRKEMQACGGTFGSANAGNCTDKQLMRAMTNSMDTIIGKVLQRVDAVAPDTYVIYLGDNGTWMFGQGREFIDNLYITRVDRSKGTAYESGARVEMAIRGPRIKGGVQNSVPVNGVDLFATILDLAGLPVPKTVPDRNGRMVRPDGLSLIAAAVQWREAAARSLAGLPARRDHEPGEAEHAARGGAQRAATRSSAPTMPRPPAASSTTSTRIRWRNTSWPNPPAASPTKRARGSRLLPTGATATCTRCWRRNPSCRSPSPPRRQRRTAGRHPAARAARWPCAPPLQ